MTSANQFENLFAFAIPLLPKSRAANWNRVLDNLQATLQSILNQKDQNFICLLAVEDPIPLPEVSNPKVTLVNITAAQRKSFQRDNYDQANQDSWCKKSIMMTVAERLETKYIMFMDADDLISNSIVEYTRNLKPRYGVALRNGLVMDSQTGKCLPTPSKFVPVEGFDTYCGSSIIFNLATCQNESTSRKSRLWQTGHNIVRATAIANDTPLHDCWESMGIYMLNHGDNISMLESNKPPHKSFAQQTIENINRHGSPLTKAQLIEFGLWSV
jgi:hypothetical protein